MPEQVLTMSQAELERRIEDKLRAVRDGGSPSNGRPAQNLRPTDTGDSSRQPRQAAWRGSVDANAHRQSQLTREEAGHVLAFFRGVQENDRRTIERSIGALSQRDPQSVGVLEDGGYTAPEQFVSEVLIDLPRLTPFADPNLIRIVPMAKETMRWTKVKTRPDQPSYVPEGTVYPKSKIGFSPITLVAKKIGEIIPFTDEILMSNEVAMVSVVSELVAEAFAFNYNHLVTNGNNSAGEPEGVLTNTDVNTEPWTLTNDATKADSLIATFHALASQYRANAIWIMHDDNIKMIRQLKDLENRYLWTDGFGATPPSILGRPVFENPDMATTEILFGNFKRGYVLGKREGMTVQQNSSGEDWEKDIVNFKFRERWDGRVHDEKAFVIGTGVTA